MPAAVGRPTSAGMALAYPDILRKLRVEELVQSPTTLCLLGVFVMVVVSHLAHSFTWGARRACSTRRTTKSPSFRRSSASSPIATLRGG